MRIILLMIQIITESLPISSSTHVRVAEHVLRRMGYCDELPRSLLWTVHGITAALMVLLLARVWYPLIRHPWRCRWIIMRLALYGFCAEVVTVATYYLLYQLGVEHLSPVYGLLVTAGILYSTKSTRAHRCGHTFYFWLILGFVQGIAIIPGLSRLALTYSAARWLGYSGVHAWRLTCTLAIPLFAAASAVGLYELFSDISLRYFFTIEHIALMLLATLIAGCALAAVRFTMIHNTVHYFAWYVAACALFVAFVLV